MFAPHVGASQKSHLKSQTCDVKSAKPHVFTSHVNARSQSITAGTTPSGLSNDLSYVLELLQQVEARGIPAPGPIEQRWTCGCGSPMSPSYAGGANPREKIFTWVGIIMYRTGKSAADIGQIDRKFFTEYATMHLQKTLEYGGVCHWAKIPMQPPHTLAVNDGINDGTGGAGADGSSGAAAQGAVDSAWAALRAGAAATVRQRFDLEKWRAIRDKYDPTRALGPDFWEA